MMTSLKIMLGFLYGLFIASLVWFVAGRWEAVVNDKVAFSALSGLVALNLFFILALIVRFFVVNWRRR